LPRVREDLYRPLQSVELRVKIGSCHLLCGFMIWALVLGSSFLDSHR
jgi:hypothetical protein